jgi:uncharacterized protein (TIGR02611 family)
MIHTTIRAGRIVIGLVLLFGGTAMLVLPGPGVLLMVGGLALLGREFHWARRANDWLRRQSGRVLGRSDG